jgi:hypothetical protein
MLESGSSGSVRGVPSNGHPYRDPGAGRATPGAKAEWPKSAESSLRPTAMEPRGSTRRRHLWIRRVRTLDSTAEPAGAQASPKTRLRQS